MFCWTFILQDYFCQICSICTASSNCLMLIRIFKPRHAILTLEFLILIFPTYIIYCCFQCCQLWPDLVFQISQDLFWQIHTYIILLTKIHQQIIGQCKLKIRESSNLQPLISNEFFHPVNCLQYSLLVFW